MPRFYFHIDDGTASGCGGHGTRRPDDAKRQAVEATGEMLRDLDGHFWKSGAPWTMHVTNEAGVLQFCLSFTAFQPSGEVRYLPNRTTSALDPIGISSAKKSLFS
jgi:hypothetical protein